MSVLEVWVSTSKERPALDLGDNWERAGEVDTTHQPAAQKFWKGIWRTAAAPKGKSTKFHILVDPATLWFSALDPETQTRLENGFGAPGAPAFWLAFHWTVTPARTYYSIKPSQFAVIAGRAPDAHPGLRVARLALGVKVSWADGPYFDIVEERSGSHTGTSSYQDPANSQPESVDAVDRLR